MHAFHVAKVSVTATGDAKKALHTYRTTSMQNKVLSREMPCFLTVHCRNRSQTQQFYPCVNFRPEVNSSDIFLSQLQLDQMDYKLSLTDCEKGFYPLFPNVAWISADFDHDKVPFSGSFRLEYSDPFSVVFDPTTSTEAMSPSPMHIIAFLAGLLCTGLLLHRFLRYLSFYLETTSRTPLTQEFDVLSHKGPDIISLIAPTNTTMASNKASSLVIQEQTLPAFMPDNDERASLTAHSEVNKDLLHLAQQVGFIDSDNAPFLTLELEDDSVIVVPLLPEDGGL
ncbi:hypothetical protein AC1031_013253 [Aphanomyces cochlioides]|nr:hypothetical protein AC1031_013253 [Aphanomyces cochlioides]